QSVFAHAGRGLIELDHFFVKIHEHVEVVSQNRRGLEQRLVWRQTSVGPDFKDELVVIGALTDTSVFDRVLDARDRRKDGIDRNQADRLVCALVFLSSGKTTTDPHIELGLEFVLLVQGANDLLGIEHFKTLNGLDVAGSDLAFFVYSKGKFLGLVILALGVEFYLFEVEDYVGHIFDHAWKGGEFMLRARDFCCGDGSAFQRGKQDAPE